MGKGGAKDRVAEVGAAPRLRGPAASVGCGADVRLVVPQPQDEQGLREAVRHQRGIRLCGDGTLDGEAVGSCLGISRQFLERLFSEVGARLPSGASCPLLGKRRNRRPMNSKEVHLVSEDPLPINNGIQEETPSRQDVDVLLNVEELEVDKIKLTVKDLRAHVSVLAELASLVNLQVGVDARLDEVELEIDGVRAKVLLKVRLDEVRAILNHALNTVAE